MEEGEGVPPVGSGSAQYVGRPAARARGPERSRRTEPASEFEAEPGKTRIGVISDTHGYLDSRVLEIFAGVQHIIHAGDVVDPEIITELRRIAPLTAVAGNLDKGDLAAGLSREASARLAAFVSSSPTNPGACASVWRPARSTSPRGRSSTSSCGVTSTCPRRRGSTAHST